MSGYSQSAKTSMVMLAKEIKVSLVVLGILAVVFTDCPTKSEASQSYPTLKVRRAFLQKYFTNYQDVYGMAVDSINDYVADSLRYVAGLIHYPPWYLDSIFVFNSDSTRFYTKLYTAGNLPRDGVNDYIDDFGGAYIDNQWYFFKMGTFTVVPRGDYHHDPYEPLTFEELSYIAWRRAIPGLIYRRRDGSIATDHKAIDRMFCETGRTICPDKETACVCNDSMTVAQGRHRRQFKLTKEDILKIQQEIQNSKKPYVPPYKELTDEDRRRGKEEKLFDSKAWRDRYNYKNEEDEG